MGHCLLVLFLLQSFHAVIPLNPRIIYITRVDYHAVLPGSG
jgi:hypothetical protein